MHHGRNGVTRRWLLATGLSIGVVACASAGSERILDSEQAHGRLHSRPKAQSASTLKPGEQPLGLGKGNERDGVIYVPRDLPTNGPVPLIVLLHGATGAGKGITSRLGAPEIGDRYKAIVLAPDSRGRTWDMIRGEFGPDVAFLDRALDQIFSRVTIDPTRVAVGGFSDGASYALSLGVINGDLFTHILAFSPGFLVADHTYGKPAIFVSHGTSDEILPIDTTSHRLVPALRKVGYPVEFRVFAGPHTVPPDIVKEAFEWMFAQHAAPTNGR
jgi:phospholipase/carboxylesterase